VDIGSVLLGVFSFCVAIGLSILTVRFIHKLPSMQSPPKITAGPQGRADAPLKPAPIRPANFEPNPASAPQVAPSPTASLPRQTETLSERRLADIERHTRDASNALREMKKTVEAANKKLGTVYVFLAIIIGQLFSIGWHLIGH
jgi:hypothetical protein